MEDTQKQDKLPPIKYTKRVGHLFEHVRDLDNLKEAIKDAARHKRKRKEVQKVLHCNPDNTCRRTYEPCTDSCRSFGSCGECVAYFIPAGQQPCRSCNKLNVGGR